VPFRARQSQAPYADGRPRASGRRRGSALIYLTVTLVALVGFTSLGVDVGRVLVVRGELQLAADAAARYAAVGFKDGITVAQNYAVDAADDNTAGGTPVVLDPGQDIEFGTWNESSRTFTPLPGIARASANAIRVTACRIAARGNAVPLMMAAAIGRPTCNARAVSIVRIAVAPVAGGFVGTNNFSVGNNGLIASYNPALGAPGGGNLANNALVGSNGAIDVSNNTAIRGDVLGDDFNQGNNSSLTGRQISNAPTITYPATESPTVAGSGALNVPGNSTMTLPAGTYNYSSINVGHGAVLTFSGEATVYVTGTITLDNQAKLAGAGDHPGRLNLRVVGSGSVQAGNNAVLIANLYAPRSSVSFGNNGEIRGSVAAQVLNMGNNASLYFDSSSSASSAGSGVVILD
jgi:hypothetical protein